MNSEPNNSLNQFTDVTKNMCMCSATSIFLILLFILSPLSNMFKTSLFMKIIIIIVLIYTIYLNYKQTMYLKNSDLKTKSQQHASQLNINIICSYIFTIFLGLLIIFVLKSLLHLEKNMQ